MTRESVQEGTLSLLIKFSGAGGTSSGDSVAVLFTTERPENSARKRETLVLLFGGQISAAQWSLC